MKNQSLPTLFAILLFALVPASLPAAEEFWDPNGTIVGTSVSGNWNTVTSNWTATADSVGSNAWVQGDSANFGLAGTYTVTLTEPISLGNLTATGTAGGLTISGTAPNILTLASSSTFNITNSSRTVTVSAPIAGTFDLTKSGNGGLTLSGTNTYSGGTTLSAGTATLGVDSVYSGGIISGPFGTGPVNVTIVTPSTTVTMSPSGARALDNQIILNTNLTIGGSAALTFRNGGWQLNSANRTVTVNNIADTTLQNLTDDSGARTLTKAGSGRLIMMTTNSPFLGGITASAGTLVAGNPAPFPTNINNAITVNGSSLDLNGFNVTLSRLAGNASGKVLLGANTLTVGCTASSEFFGVISGTGGYVKVGSTSQVLTGTNTFTGGITIAEGALYFPTNGVSGTNISLGAGPNTITIIGTGRIGVNRGTGIVTNNVVLATAGPLAGLDPPSGSLFILAGQVSGSGGFYRYSQGSGFPVLTGNNTFTGGVQMDERSLGLGHKNAIGTGPLVIGHPTIAPVNALQLASYNLDLVGVNAITNVVTINQNFTFNGTLTGFGLELSGPVTLNGTRTITATGTGLAELSGNIQGSGGLTKAGSNSLTLAGANSYESSTLVSDGTLLVNNTSGSGTGPNTVTVTSPGVLGGTGAIAGPVTISGGFISPGNSAGKLTLQNGLDMSSSGTETWELAALKDNATGAAGTDFDQVALTGGDLNLGTSATLSLSFIGSTAPSVTNGFWHSSHTWTVVKLTAPAANPGGTAFSAINNGSYSVGRFTNSVAGDGSILLTFTATPAPSISNVSKSGNDVNISFVAANGSNYRVEYTTSLSPANWQLLQNVPGTGASVTVTDVNPSDPQRFYRVVLTD